MIQSVNKYHIYEIFSSDGNFYYTIPKYQREYTWSYREWEALYDDISENSDEYFIGSIICIPLGDTINPYLEVIDGQQRLTTISIFLTAIYTRLKDHVDYLSEDDGDVLPSLRKSLKSKNSPNEMKLVPQVQNFNKDDYDYLLNEVGLRKATAPKHAYYFMRKIARCYTYFLKRLDKEMEGMDGDGAVNFLLGKYNKVKQAMLVKIEVSTHSDAYVLFESLNNRGTPLTAIDLMKNLIMARAESNNLTIDDCFNRWQMLLGNLSDDYGIQERFFRHYYNAFKHRLNEPFQSDNDRKKDPLGVVATRSNLLNILASYLILILAFINSKKLNRLIACSLIVAPIVLLSLGIMGTFNIFKIEEYDLNITNELTEKSGEDELFIDSRTAVYNNIIGTVYNENALFFGKGYSGKAEYEMDVFGITDQGREGSESGFLNRLLFGGIIAVSLNFLLVLVSIYSGLFKSRNKLSELLAIWLSYKWFFSFIEDPSINGFWVIFFMNMIVVGMLLSKQFRNMNDNDVRFFVNSIFNFKYKYDVYPPIDKRK